MIPKETVIYGVVGSAAEAYAQKFSHPFVAVSGISVSFETNGGSPMASVAVSDSGAASKPANPKKDGFVFLGWYADAACKTAFNFGKVTENATAYAKRMTAEACICMSIDSTEAAVFGKTVTNDVAPIIANNRTMLPVRFVAEALGAAVGWNAEERKATISKGGVVIELVLDSTTATVNGQPVALDSPAFVQNNRTYMPVRFIAETLGAKVEWDAVEKRAILIP